MSSEIHNKSIPVLYEDNHLLVVEKPVNIPTQEDESGDADVLNMLKEDLKRRHAKQGNVYLGLVHRLDRPVGGVMVFAKTSKAASRLSEAIRVRHFTKLYSAVVHGTPSQPIGTLQHFLSKDAKTNTVKTVAETHRDAKLAVLDYRVKQSHGGLCLVHVRLQTGRSHQIRVQFAAIGCPLYGDQKYGADRNKPGQQIALWSSVVGFDHPTLKEPLLFVSSPPRIYPWNLWSEGALNPDERFSDLDELND